MKVVDLFAGWGGFTSAAQLAGHQVVWAGNHWPLAVETHARNHPGVKHVCQDLNLVDWRDLPKHSLLVASPACQGHSEASQPGRRAYHATQRATAWAVVDCLEVTRTSQFIIENVPQFVEWDLYELWLAALRKLGYKITAQVVNAVWSGVPQLRNRLFVTGSLRRELPALTGPAKPREIPFAPLIEWDAPGWRPIKACRGVAARVRLEASKRFGASAIVQHVTGHKGLDPFVSSARTMTTKDQWVVRYKNDYRPFTLREYARAMDFSDNYVWADELPREDVVRGLGNAVPRRMAASVIRHVAEAA